MSRSTINKIGQSLVFICWIPIISLIAIEIYVRPFDGWGAWSTAPLFLLPMLLSFIIGGICIIQFIVETKRGTFRISSLISTVVALLPIAWLFIRRHII